MRNRLSKLMLTLLFAGFMFAFQGSVSAYCGDLDLFNEFEKKKESVVFSVQGLTLGQSVQEVLNPHGQPIRVDQSEYGFQWYIYNQDYTRYLQVGIENGKVVALYSNTDWSSANHDLTTKAEVESIYGNPLTKIKKGNTTTFNYKDSGIDYGLYLIEGVYIRFFYDLHREDLVTAILLVEEDVELSFKSFYGEPSLELQMSHERQLFDLVNATRVQLGKEVLEWSDQIAKVAYLHSKDMASRDYFAHRNLEGKSAFDRMKADGITYNRAAENLAAGQTNAIFAHHALMNSESHRNALLGNFNKLGVGVSFGGSYQVYYTQKFILEW